MLASCCIRKLPVDLALPFAVASCRADDGYLGRHCRYSTRELVNIVRHMTAYPADSMGKVLANVLSFDSFDETLLVRLKATFATHGLL